MGRRRRIGVAAVVGCAALTLSGCGWLGTDEASFVVVTTTTVPDQMRSVPTVASNGAEATLAPVAEDALQPPVTELVGDPQPDPDSADTLPPLPASPVVDACARLGEFSTADMIGASAGAVVEAASVGDEACRFLLGSGSGNSMVEVHYLPEGVIEADWFARAGIEPVGGVTSDAVGLAEFAPPGSAPTAGYTIALVSRREGALIAVRGTADDRTMAEQVALIVDSST